jgi:broad specificity phosphatase PhoE
MGQLILVRHGKTVLNSHDNEERLRGWLDIPLDEQGLQEAELTARRVAQYQVAHIYSSDLRRARQTSDAVMRATLAPVFFRYSDSSKSIRRCQHLGVSPSSISASGICGNSKNY